MTDGYKNWKLEKDSAGVLWLGLDKAQSSVNILSTEVLLELKTIMETLRQNPPVGMILHSLKGNGFIAGADVTEFTAIESQAQAFDFIRQVHGLFDGIESAAFPTVAMIHGFCLGGGLELALACKYRVASSDPSTRLSFPEVLLGIHPGYGGSVRSARLMGGLEALGFMLTGKSVDGKKAKRLGLVDHCVPLRNLKTAALALATGAKGAGKAGLLSRMSNLPLVRSAVAKIITRQTEKKVRKAHYPAPFALISLWKDHYGSKGEMEAEARSVAELVSGPVCRNLIRVFLLQERLKGLGGGVKFEPARVHVVGAGAMGGDIAGWLALRGWKVTLQDTAPDRVAPAIKRAGDLFKKRLVEPRLVRAAMDRLEPDVKGDGVASADIVIEAIFESLEAKRKLYAQIEPVMRKDAILATNTSSITLESLSQTLARPERFVGLHFFNPVAMMKLVEVVRGPSTDPSVISMASSFVKAMDKLPLIVRSVPGFLVNRILTPYLAEAMVMASEGIPISVIDQAALDFGMPMGPVTLADSVGLDICLSVIGVLGKEFGMEKPMELIRMTQAGRLGKKTGAGFYDYKNGQQVKPRVPQGYAPPADLQDRLALRLVNQAAECLRKKVVEDADLLDAGVIFGTGFAPFTGGPVSYARGRGAGEVKAALERLAATHGARFAPDPGLESMATPEIKPQKRS